MGVFKKLFVKEKVEIISKDEIDVISNLTKESKAEKTIEREEGSRVTSSLPQLSVKETTSSYEAFKGYEFYSSSNLGRVRKNNEDSVFTASYKFYIANTAVISGMGIVADGMGGLVKGETASRTAVASVSTYMYARLSEYIEKELPPTKVILSHIQGAIQNANEVVLDKGQSIGEDIGTTLTLVFLLGNRACFGHVGDSRAYLIDSEKRSIEKITRDHSLVGKLIEMGELTEEEAKKHPRRNEIYRMLGLRKEIEVDTAYRILNKNSIIVLLSDGLWEFVEDAEILDEIINNNDLSQGAERLIDRANSNGGLDNISIAIIKAFE